MRSFKFAFQGIVEAIRTEHNFRFMLAFFMFVVAAGVIFDITHNEWLAVLICCGMVLYGDYQYGGGSRGRPCGKGPGSACQKSKGCGGGRFACGLRILCRRGPYCFRSLYRGAFSGVNFAKHFLTNKGFSFAFTLCRFSHSRLNTQ